MTEVLAGESRPYITETEAGPVLQVTEWFHVICQGGEIEPDELSGYVSVLGLYGRDLDELEARRTINEISEIPDNELTSRLMHSGVSAVVRSPLLYPDTKVNLLKKMSESMYTAPRPVNGKSVILGHVKRFDSEMFSAAVFQGHENAYLHSQQLLWGVRKEIPRTLTRSEVYEGIFTHLTGQVAPNMLVTMFALDTVLDRTESTAQATEELYSDESRKVSLNDRERERILRQYRKHMNKVVELGDKLYPESME